MVPKIDTMENPNDPQLHAPAPAPMTEPMKPIPDFLKLLFVMRIRYMLKLVTIPDNDAIITISTKSVIEFAGTLNTTTGERKMNSETIDRETNNARNITLDT